MRAAPLSNAPERPVCIYCRATGVPFSRDHVIPEAFGKFEGNFVLTSVCGACNQFFGDELELVLGRNSREAILRLHHGVKAPAGAQQLKYDNAELTVGEPGPWRGARIMLAADPAGTTLDTRPLPQVGFKNEGETDWKWVSEAALTDSIVDPYRKSTALIQVIGPSQDDIDRLTAKINTLGINFNRKGPLPQPAREDGTMLTKLASKVEDRILRAIAKIAGNYVAYIHGAAFFLRPDFDDYRNWVRYGTPPPWSIPPVVVVTTPVLALDSSQWRQTTGHLVTFDWNRQGDGLFAQVSLFNDLNYKILLCPRYSGLLHDIRTGHHFDLQSRTISALGAATLAG